MANVVVQRKNKLVYLKSVNTPDYPNGVVNPDVSALKDVPIKYWKIVDGKVVEMTAEEKLVIDTQEKEAALLAKNSFESLTVKQLSTALVSKGIISKADLVK